MLRLRRILLTGRVVQTKRTFPIDRCVFKKNPRFRHDLPRRRNRSLNARKESRAFFVNSFGCERADRLCVCIFNHSEQIAYVINRIHWYRIIFVNPRERPIFILLETPRNAGSVLNFIVRFVGLQHDAGALHGYVGIISEIFSFPSTRIDVFKNNINDRCPNLTYAANFWRIYVRIIAETESAFCAETAEAPFAETNQDVGLIFLQPRVLGA